MLLAFLARSGISARMRSECINRELASHTRGQRRARPRACAYLPLVVPTGVVESFPGCHGGMGSLLSTRFRQPQVKSDDKV